MSCFTDEIVILSLEGPRSRSPSPPPLLPPVLQPYDDSGIPNNIAPPDCAPQLTYSSPVLISPPASPLPPVLTSPVLHQEEDNDSYMDWQPIQSQVDVISNDVSLRHPTPGSNDMKASTEISKVELAEIRQHNLCVRSLAYKEVRRPGMSK